jgi:MFS family permease
MPKGTAKPRIFTPRIALFMLAMILANLGGMMFYPFFGILLKKMGFGIETIGLYFTISAVFPLALQIFGGWISDRIGRLKSIAIGSAAGAISWIGTIVAPYSAEPLLLYLASNAIGSITAALVAPSFDAFIAESSDEANRARVFGVMQSVFMIVGIAGPPLGGLVAEKISYGALAWIAAGLYWSATVIRVLMAREASKPGSRFQVEGGSAPSSGRVAGPGFREALRGMWGLVLAGGTFLWILIIDGVFDFSGKLAGDLIPLFLREQGGLGESSIGALQSVMAIVTALAMPAIAGIADRRGERLPIAAGAAILAIASIIIAFGRGYPSFILAFALFGLGSGSAGPALQSLISKVVPESLRGLAYGFLSTSLGLFSFFAPGIGAILWKRFFPALPLVVCACLTVAAVPLVIAKLGRTTEPGRSASKPSPEP